MRKRMDPIKGILFTLLTTQLFLVGYTIDMKADLYQQSEQVAEYHEKLLRDATYEAYEASYSCGELLRDYRAHHPLEEIIQ